MYQLVFQKTSKQKQILTHPSVTNPSLQAGGDAWYPGGFYRMADTCGRLAAKRCKMFTN